MSATSTTLQTAQADILRLIDLKETCRNHCPVELLQRGVLVSGHREAACLGMVCGVCSKTGHSRSDCPSKITLPSVCWFCYLPQTLVQKEIHPQNLYGNNKCPWKEMTMTLMAMALSGDRRVVEALGNLTPKATESREQAILRRLWETPTTGDLLPLGVRLLLRLGSRNR